MAIQDDFTIFPNTKVIRHDPTKSTIYSAVSFYSYLQDTFDEPGFLSYEIPIRFNTPTSFTMLNGWFLDDGDGSNLLQFLTGGGIDTLGYATVSDPVYMVDLRNTYDFQSEDLDVTIVDDGVDVGPLLSYKNDYPDPGEARMWVRDTRAIPLLIEYASDIQTTTGTTNGFAIDDAQSGDNIYHNLFTIAAFPGSPNPQVYVYQNHPVSGSRVRIGEWSAFTNWDRGSIDILIPIQLGGSLIDSGHISSFVRQTGDTFTFVESTLNTSGRTPIATETLSDGVNITVGEHYLMYTDRNYSFTVGDVITDVPLGEIDSHLSPPSWYGEVVAVDEYADITTGVLTLRGVRGTPADLDSIYVGTIEQAIVRGSCGDTLLVYSGGTDPSHADSGVGTTGQILTGGAGALRRQRAADGVENQVICGVDETLTGSSKDLYYKTYANAEVVTGGTSGSFTLTAASNTLISGFTDVTLAHMNGTVTVSTVSGTFEFGELITWNSGASSAIFIELTGGVTMSLGNVSTLDEPNAADTFTGSSSGATANCDSTMTDDNTEDFAFALQSAFNYSVFIEGGTVYQAGRSLTDIYAYLQYYLRDGQDINARSIFTSDATTVTLVAAEEYIKSVAAYTASKPAPFGTLAGGVFFGAQGVWIQGMRTADNNNIKLTDHDGTAQEPFTSVDITVSNTRISDRVAIFLESGSTELPSKTQYTSDNLLNVLGDSTFERDTGAFPNDTPTSGSFIVVDNALNKQHRYRYISRNGTTNPGILTLPTQIGPNVSDGSTANQTLEDSSENFNATVQVGDIIHRTTGTLGFCYVTAVSTAIITTTLLEDTTDVSSNKNWTISDQYEIHSLVKSYTNADRFFIPYMDEIENAGTDGTPGSITVSLTYVADREILLEVRNVEATTQIVPFKTTGTITNTGYTQGVIRNEDTVFTA